MKIQVLRTAQTIKCDKEDNIWYGPDYDIRAFYNPKIQATMIRVENTKKGKVTYTSFANVAYCDVDESEFLVAAPERPGAVAAKPKPTKPVTTRAKPKDINP